MSVFQRTDHWKEKLQHVALSGPIAHTITLPLEDDHTLVVDLGCALQIFIVKKKLLEKPTSFLSSSLQHVETLYKHLFLYQVKYIDCFCG